MSDPAVSFALARGILRWLLAALFIAAGAAHLAVPAPFIKITPDWVPFAAQVIFVTGLCELAGAVALLADDVLHAIGLADRYPLLGRRLRTLRWAAGIAFAAYAICVWPANIKQAIDGIVIPPVPDSWWYHAPRLAFQPVIVWCALFSSGVVDWPFARPVKRPNSCG